MISFKGEKVDSFKRKMRMVQEIVVESLAEQAKSNIAVKAGLVMGAASVVKTRNLKVGMVTTNRVIATIVAANVGWDLATNIERIKKA
jgi:hypothetical protein